MMPWNAGRAVAGKPHSVIDPLPSDRERRRIRTSPVVNTTTDLRIYKGLAMIWLVERLPNRSGLGVDRNAVRGPS